MVIISFRTMTTDKRVNAILEKESQCLPKVYETKTNIPRLRLRLSASNGNKQRCVYLNNLENKNTLDKCVLNFAIQMQDANAQIF